MTIDQAIDYLRKEYEKAMRNPAVRSPLAYALYHTWRFVDAKGKKEENDGKAERGHH